MSALSAFGGTVESDVRAYAGHEGPLGRPRFGWWRSFIVIARDKDLIIRRIRWCIYPCSWSCTAMAYNADAVSTVSLANMTVFMSRLVDPSQQCSQRTHSSRRILCTF